MRDKLLLVLFFCLSGWSFGYAQDDSVLIYEDDELNEVMDPTSRFFRNGEKVPDPRKLVLLDKTGKSTTLHAWLATEDRLLANHCLADLDNDGVKELVISGYTGGAHCCDEIFIYRNTGPGQYRYAAKIFGGHTLINTRREFEFSFDESFGYFFTCYACGLSDSSASAPVPLRRITLQYKKGKLAVVPGTRELEDLVRTNLQKLGRLPYGKLENEQAMDEGQRKEVAMNLAVYYYSFGKNLEQTRKLFTNYYRFPDAGKVWSAFSKSLLYIKKDNDF